MRVIVISVLLFISVVVGDEGGVAINPAEEAGIGETVNHVKVGIKSNCERNCKPMRNEQPEKTTVSLLYSLKVYF